MSFRIVQVSDCHLFSDPEKTSYNDINPYQSLKAVLQSAANESPDLLLLTGDLSGDDTEQSYHHLKQLLSKPYLPNQIRMLPGNHDLPDTMREMFGNDICRFEGIEEFGNWRFHYLNSHYKGTLGMVSEERLQSLQYDILNEPHMQHIVVVHHHALDTMSWMDKHEWINRSKFLQLMHFLPRPIRVLYGHIHSDVFRSFSGQEYYACPSSCWQWQLSEEFAVSDEHPGYRVIELGDNGEWLTWVNRI